MRFISKLGSRNTRKSVSERKSCALRAATRSTIELLEARIFLSVTNAWKAAVSGDFDNPAMWSLGHVPTPGEDAVINLAGSYSVTHNTAAADNINSLLSTQPFTLSAGSLNVSTTVEVDNTFTLSGGTLIHATVLAGSGGQGLIATTAGGTLDGVTLNANLDLTASQANLTSVDGLTLDDTATLGQYGRIYFNNTQTLGGSGNVLFQGTAPNALIANATGMTLTVGPQMTLHGGSTYGTYGGTIGSSVYWGNPAGTTVVNLGTIDADGGASTHLLVNPNGGSFINQGTLQASAGSNLIINGAAAINDPGTLVGATSSTITVTGNLLGNTTNAAGWNSQGPVTFNGTGTAGSPQLLEAMGQDLGAVAAGFQQNFAYSQLALSNQTYVRLVDQSQNITGGSTANAVYVGTLVVPSGCTLDLNGLNLYTLASNVQGTVLNGSVTVVSGGGFPDLTPQSVTANAANTGIVSINWNDVNGGASNVTSSFTDQVQLLDVTAGNVVLDTRTLLYNESSSGPIVFNGGAVARSVAFNLASYSSFKIGDVLNAVVILDLNNNVFETTKTNNTATVTVSQAAVPNLSVSGLGINGDSTGKVTVSWSDLNGGAGRVTQPYYDSVTVIDTITGTTIYSNALYMDAGSNPIAAGASAPGSLSFSLPTGFNVAHLLKATVKTDANNNIFETNEADNSAGITATGPLANYPDLVVQNLGVAPTSPQSGQVLTINWLDVNSGSGTASGAWYDRIQVINTTTNQTLVDTTQLYTTNNVVADSSAVRSYSFTLPNGAAGAGNLSVTVTVNSNNSAFEYNSNGTATTNNSANTTVTSTIPAYPDLSVTGLSAAAGADGKIVINWNDVNNGNGAASSPFNDSVVVTDTTLNQQVNATTVHFDPSSGSIAAGGGSLARQATFQLPRGFAAGDALSVTVHTDSDGGAFDSNPANNTATTGVTLGPVPDLSVKNLVAAQDASGRVTASWSDANASGAAAVSTSFSDLIALTDTTTGQQVTSTTLVYNSSAFGPIAAGSSVPRQVTLQLPQGFSATDALSLKVTTDYDGGAFEYNTADDVSTMSVPRSAAADLSVVNLSAGLLASGKVVVGWNDSDAMGAANVNGTFFDSIVLTDTRTGQIVGSQSTSFGGAIAAGGISPGRSATFQLQQGFADLDKLSVSVTVDANSGVYESNTSNDSATASVVNAAVADLSVGTLSSSESATGLVTITWTDVNAAEAAAASTAFYDFVTLVDTTTHQTLGGISVLYDAGTANIQPGGTSTPRTTTFQLSQSIASTDQLSATVVVNNNSAVFESNAANNSSTGAVTRAVLPHLSVSNVTGPATALPGQTISAAWTLTNDGGADANGAWTETVFLASDAAGDNPIGLGTFTFTGPLAAGTSVPRSVNVTVPTYITGNRYLVVQEDANGALFQSATDASRLVSASPISVPTALTLTLGSSSVREDAGASATTLTIARNTTAGALLVSLGNSLPSQVSIPATAVIPDGKSSVTVTLGTIDDGLATANQTAAITASATGFTGGSANLTVINTDAAALSVSIDNTTFSEDAGATAATATVTRNTPTDQPLTLSLTTNNIYKAAVPSSITIPAGSASVSFPISAINDGLIDGPVSVSLTAAASGLASGSKSFTVTDVNVPNLTVTLSTNTVSEAAGNPAAMGHVTLPKAQQTSVAITLISSDTTAVTLPSVVYIPVGQTSVSFPISVLDDGIADADKAVTITGKVTTYIGTVLDQGSSSALLNVLNADGPALRLSLASAAISAGGGQTTATVSRNTADVSQPLLVTLTSSNTTHATVPASVTIPAGSPSATFTVTGVDDGLADGLQHADITATAPGLATAVTTIAVSTVDLPDLVVTAVTAPASGYDTNTMTITWTVKNIGRYAADGSWLDQIYFDPAGGPRSSSPLDTLAFNGVLGAGQSYTENDVLPFPSTVGTYSARIVTDSDQNLQELSFSNNTGIAAASTNDRALYHATVQANASRVVNGTPVVLSGVATRTDNGQPAANFPVDVRVLVNGTRRVLTGTTDSTGHYSVTFQPLKYEAGEYSVAADDPGVAADVVQTHFEIVGMSVAPSSNSVQVTPGIPLTGSVTLNNLSAADLTGLVITSNNLPSDLAVQANAPGTLAGNGKVTLSYTFTSTATQAESGTITLHVATDQGATLDIPISVRVIPLTPRLIANPGFLNTGMLVGAQTLVTFTLTNTGGAPTGNLTVGLPSTDYLTLVTPASIPSLAPGASSTITLSLTPAANLPLVEFNGTIGIGNTATGISVPFTFRAISSAVGDVQVLVDDDYTFQETGSPHVAGATVQLLDAYDNSNVVATGTTDATGNITLPSVPAGPYLLRVSADSHATYQASFTVVPGIINSTEVFIAREFVTYSFVVRQTTIQDTYQIQLQTTFVTDVPAPVVTATGPSSIPLLQPGQSGTFNMTVTNHGLIAADNVMVGLPTDPEYTFSTLSATIGELPAKSSITVPITVTRAGSLANDIMYDSRMSPNDSSPSPCSLNIKFEYQYQCGGNEVSHQFIDPINIPGRDCNAQEVVDSIEKGFGPTIGSGTGTLGNPTGGSGTGGGADPGPDVEASSNCSPCLEHIAVNAFQIVLDKTEVGQVATSFFSTIRNVGNALNGSPLDLIKQIGGLIKSATQADSGAPPDATGSGNGTLNPALTLSKSSIWSGLKAIWSVKDQLLDVINACGGNWLGSSSIGSPGGSGSNERPADSYQPPAYYADPADIGEAETLYNRIIEITNAYSTILGTDGDWIASNQGATLQQWFGAFLGAIDVSSDGGSKITPDERNALLATTLPDPVTAADANDLIDRWNRSVDYFNAGIDTVAQVPAGQSTKFFDRDSLVNAFAAAGDAIDATAADGYSDIMDDIRAAVAKTEQDVAGQGVCATVKLQIDQTATLTRSAFTGTLTLKNGMANNALQNVKLTLIVTDANGNPVDGKFFISDPKLGGGLTAVDGTGALAALATGTAEFTFIPTDSAAPNAATQYHIGGTLSYNDPDMGGLVTTPIFPTTITVYPQAKLQLNYFLQKDVIGDDPFTDVVEPSEPATLGLLVSNVGKGSANNLSISTAQPKIIENAKGLLDTFTIVGTQVGSAKETPSLNISFGDLAPGATGDASFLITSTLQGIFTNFTATFTHADNLGGMDTSLIASVTTHTLIHAGDFAFANDTGSTSYLAENTPNVGDLPDMIYFSDGTTAAVNQATNPASSPLTGGLSFAVSANVTSGWDYLQMPDPGAGYTLYKVVRSDGTPIRVGDQAWTTDRTFDSAGVAHIDYELHLLDDNSTGIYTVYFKPAVTGPVSVASVGPVSSPQTSGVVSVPVAFNEPIDPTTFTFANLSLSANGGPNLIGANSGIIITQTSPSTFNIGGLNLLTAAGGNYLLTVSATGIGDPFGDAGAGSLSAGWATAGNEPIVVSVGANNPARRNTPLDAATVIFTQAINPNSFDDGDISLTLGSDPTNRITSGVTITQLSDTTYQISGLSALTAADGIYTLTVNASGISDMQGASGIGSASETWATSTVAPTIAALQGGFQSPRNIVVPSIDITFSEPIDPTTFRYQDIAYSKTGGPNLITSAITIAPIAGSNDTEFEISNFNNFVSSIDGSYTFTVNTSGVTDLYGNVATGTETGSTASDMFVLQTTAPAAPTGLAITPDTGVSATDNLTDTGKITLTGTIAEPGLAVEVYDGLTIHLADAVVTGTSFSATLSLSPGSHNLRVYAVDSAANVSTDSYDMIFVDTTAPTAVFAAPAQSTPQSVVSSVQFSFGKIIDGTTLSPGDLSLSLNGGPNSIDASVSIQLVSAATNTYRINGLAGLNASPGSYVLRLDTTQVRDLAGNFGIAATTIDWSVAPAKVAAAFGNLTASQVLDRGSASIVLSGAVSGGSTLPAAGETVSITVNGVSQNATINASGGFAASFDVSALPVSPTPYAVTYAYAGDSVLFAVSDSTTTSLRIAALPATVTLSAAPSQIAYDGTTDVTAWAIGSLSGAANGLTPTGSIALEFFMGATPIGTPMSSPPVNAGTYTVVASYDGDANFLAAQSAPLTFTISRATPTVSLSSPPSSITYDSTNSVTAWVKASVIGVGGAPSPSGPISYIYYTGTTASGTPLSAPPVNAGTYTVVAAYGGNSNYLSGQSGPVTFTISQPTAPLSAFFKVDDGTAQRSMVRSLTVTFSSAVSIQNGAITLTDSNGNPIAFTLATTDNTVFTLTFTGSQFVGGSLANGRYVLKVHAALVSAGSAHLSGDQTLNVWRLFGDFYGTGSVNNADKILFAQVYKGLNPAYSAYFDYDANGVFNASDLNAFVQDFGKSI